MAYARVEQPVEPDEIVEPMAPESLAIDEQEPIAAPAASDKLAAWAQMPNIAAELDELQLADIGQRVKREYEIDLLTTSEWRRKAKLSMDLAMQVAKEKQYPWPKASNVIFPLLTTAAIQFAARAYPAIVSGRNVVRGVVVGSDEGEPFLDAMGRMIPNPDNPQQPIWAVHPGAKRTKAEKIGEHMSWQLLSEQPEWEAETDTLLHVLPIIGCCFRKTYFDSAKGRNAALLVSATSLVINYFAKSVEDSPRMTEELRLYPREIEENERAGIFLEQDYQPATMPESKTGLAELHDQPTVAEGDDDAPHDFLEQHRWLDLDEDGYPEPYIVTVHSQSAKVVRIVARYDVDGIVIAQDGRVAKIKPIIYYTKYDFIPNPDGGIYGIGFGHLLRPINEAVNTSLNMMFDASHLAITGGGFIGKGVSMHAGQVLFRPGEWKTVNVTGGTLRDSVVPLPIPEASPVLFQLLGSLIEAGRDVSAVKDVLTGDQKQQNVPATTTLALIEQGLRVFTSIYKRIHRSLKQEFEKLYRLNGLYLPDTTQYRVGDEWRTISRNDYTVESGVEPVSDPAIVTDMQRLAKAQYLMQFAGDPFFNPMEIRKRVLEAAQIEKIEQLLMVPPPPPPPPEIIIEGLRMEMEAKLNATVELKNLATAINQLASAEKAGAEGEAASQKTDLEWLRTNLEALKLQFGDAVVRGGKPLPGMEMPALQGEEKPVKPRIPRGGGMAGARQAPDGNWYVPDPKRPGKYLMLEPDGGVQQTGKRASKNLPSPGGAIASGMIGGG